MRAIQVKRLDGPSAVELVEINQPSPGRDEVLIEVKSAGIAFPDVLQSRGLYQHKPELPYTPGPEVAGIVVSGPASSGFATGDRVVGFPGLGALAEYAAVATDMVFPLPDSVSFDIGAAIPLNYLTMHFGLVVRGQLAAGESVLVHGAAGGIGIASIQVAKAFGAGKVIAVTSTDEKGRIAVSCGADEYVLADGFKDAVVAQGGVDIVVDPVGGDRFTDSLRSLKEDGRLLVVGFTAGSIPEVKVNRLLLNNIAVVGVGWGAYAFPKPGYVQGEWAALLPHLESGLLAPPIGSTLPLEQAAEGLRIIDEREAIGKILLHP